MSDFEIFDDRFRSYVMHNAPLERLGTGFRWVEGPVWFGDGNFLLFSDIPNNRIMRWSEAGISVFREPANYANGHTRDLQGRLISCEHGGRRVSRTEYDGTVVNLIDRFEGKRLNSPNDVVVKSDGSIWFTDPSYGIMTDYEGDIAESENPDVVYRFDPETSQLTVVTDAALKPNGLCFSPDEKTFYLADTGASHKVGGPHHIMAFDVGTDGKTLSNQRVFADITPGMADGFRCDIHGNVWSSAADGVHCYAADGTLLGKVKTPELVGNIVFGGRKKNRLFICATTSVYSVYLNTKGVQLP